MEKDTIPLATDGIPHKLAPDSKGEGAVARLRRMGFIVATSLMNLVGAVDAAPPKVTLNPANRQPLATASQADAGSSPMDEARRQNNFVSVSTSIAQAEENVRNLGLLTIEHGYDRDNKSEAAMRNPSLVRPTQYDLVPIALSQEVIATGKAGARILQPSPRRVLDFDSAGCKVIVVDAKGKPVDVESDVIYSKPDNGNDGFLNPFIRIRFIGKPDGKFHVHVVHYVIMPEYPTVLSQELSSRLGPQASSKIQKAYDAGTSSKWTRINHCGVKADKASRAGGPTAHTVEGWSYRCPSDADFGGMHTINVFEQGLVADCRDAQLLGTANGPYIGMPRGFIFGPIDRPYTIPGWGSGPHNGSNHGLDEFIGARDIQLSVAPYGSFQGFGAFSQALAQQGVPSEVEEYARTLWADHIMSRYDQPRIAAAGEE